MFSPFLTESQLCYVRELEAKEEKDSCIHYMRALAIGKSIQSAVDSFVNHEEDLLQGRLEQSLIDSSELAAPLNGLYQYASRMCTRPGRLLKWKPWVIRYWEN